MPRPLLIFDLEGTLADIFLADKHRPRHLLIHRLRMVEGLKMLRAYTEEYNIALATKAQPEQVKLFLNYVQQQGFEFDSVHQGEEVIPKLPEGFEIQQSRLKDISGIYVRHKISVDEISSRVLVIEDIQLRLEDIFIGEKIFSYSGSKYTETKQPEDLLFSGFQCNAYGNPVPVNGKVPAVLLIPNPKKEQQLQTFSMDIVVDLIRAAYEAGEGDFEKGYHHLNREDIIKYESDVHRMDKYSLCRNPTTLLNKKIQELCAPFTHRYLIVKGDSHPLEACERITL